MLKIYIKAGIRNLFRDKINTVINILGLAIGLSATILILSWVDSQYSVNRYHRNIDRVFEICANFKTDNAATTLTEIPAAITSYLRINNRQIQEIARVKDENKIQQVINCNGKKFVEDGIGYTENELFSILDLPIERGNSTTPIANGSSVVLTGSTARKYYGDQDPIGKTLQFKGKSFVVSAVMNDFPENSTIHFDMLFSLDVVRSEFQGNGNWKTIDEDWGDYDYTTYCLAQNGMNIPASATALSNALQKANPSSFSLNFTFVPFSRIYLYGPDGNDGRIVAVKVFFAIAIAILLLASFNYINLVVAKATQRIRDVIIRKLAGATRRQIIIQFFIETGILVTISILISLIIVLLALPTYNSILGSDQLQLFSTWSLWKIVLITLGLTVTVTSVYPAILLSAFNPVRSLKRSTGFFRGGMIQKGLVVIQFVTSISLLLGTVLIHRQMSFILHKNLQIDTQNIIEFPVEQIADHIREFTDDLRSVSGVTGAATSNSALFGHVRATGDVDWQGKPSDSKVIFSLFNVDTSFMPLFNMTFSSGSGFKDAFVAEPKFILNETAVLQMGIKDPIGKKIKVRQSTGTIVGVVNDFNFESLHKKIAPAVIANSSNNAAFVYVRFAQKDANLVINAANSIWKKYEADIPLEHHFLNEQVADSYDTEIRLSRLFDIFSGIGLFIACLGLFGLSVYTVERRIKEIAIRKVLGADVRTVAFLLLRQFVVLVLLSICIAVPLVVIGISRFYDQFAYRAGATWWLFAITCLGALGLAAIVVSFQAVSGALVSPARSLRNE